MDLGLNGKTAIVTGGSAGLGAAVCSVLVEEGANAAAFSRSGGHPGPLPPEKSLLIKGDVTCAADIERAIAAAHDRFGGVDILVNNAGFWPTDRVVEMSDEAWEHGLRVNLTGAVMFAKRFVQYLNARQQRGQIINIVSPVAFQGSGNGHSHYAAAKAGLVSFTQSLAWETAASGIRVVAVAPGIMETAMTEPVLSQRRDEYRKRIPLGRFIETVEVARVVVFLASDRASCMTGTTVDASGGQLGR